MSTVIDGPEVPLVRWVDQRWMEQAACKGRTALFFPTYAERPQARQRREAKALALCARCPVQQTCREWGRQHHEYGISSGSGAGRTKRSGCWPATR